jgi:hypothetical protein
METVARGEERICGSWKGEKHTFQNALKPHQLNGHRLGSDVQHLPRL